MSVSGLSFSGTILWGSLSVAEHRLFLPSLGSACAACLGPWRIPVGNFRAVESWTLSRQCTPTRMHRMTLGSIYFSSHPALCLLASLSWSWSWCSWWPSSSVFGILCFPTLIWKEFSVLWILILSPRETLKAMVLFSLTSVCLNEFWNSCIWSRKFRLANFYHSLRRLKISSALIPATRIPKSGQCLESSKNSNDPRNEFC